MTKPDHRKFLEVLFDPEDYICPCSRTTPTGQPIDIATIRMKNFIWNPEYQWVSANAFKPYSTRRVSNVCKFRNFILEVDESDWSQEDHIKYFDQFNIPYSIITYSGNKSYHTIISLQEPISDIDYKYISNILKILLCNIDTACLEPSTFTRLAGSKRNNGSEQKLIFCKNRIENKKFFEWLESDHIQDIIRKNKSKEYTPYNVKFETINDLKPISKKLLKEGIIKTGNIARHTKLKLLCIDLFKAGWPKDKALTTAVECYLKHNKDKTEVDVIRMIDWVYNQSDFNKGEINGI